MTVKEFQIYIEKEYLFQKVLDYIFATIFSVGGAVFLDGVTFSNWSDSTNLIMFLFTILLSICIIYIGFSGFFRIPKVTEIHSVQTDAGLQSNKEMVLNLAKQHKMFLYPYELEDCIIKLETKNFFLAKKEIFVFCTDKGIYFNVQHVNYRDPKYGYYHSTKKLIDRIKTDLQKDR